ncbi:hypothetical protein ACFQ1R_11600, partial [Mariniflexile jejuense]
VGNNLNMAQGFITIEDGSCYISSWRAYDEIIRIVANELSINKKGLELSIWLSKKVPKEYKLNDSNQWGTGFIDQESGKMIIGKDLDLRGLNEQNQEIFWNGLQNGFEKLINNELKTKFNNDAFKTTVKRLLEMRKLSLLNENPLEHSDLKMIPEFEGVINLNE